MSEEFHRAFGIYGIIGDSDSLVVIRKNGGPYINRYDLPGGSLESGEPLDQAILREIHEETDLTVKAVQQLGITSFRYPWAYQEWRMNQHICVFYAVTDYQGTVAAQVAQFVGQDALGAVRLPLDALTIDNASPLVLKAKEYLQTQQFDPTDTTFANWSVLEKPVW